MVLWRRIPLFVFFLIAAGVIMLVPSLYAYAQGNHDVARPFFYGFITTMVMVVMFTLTLINRTPRVTARSHLLTLMGTYILLPIWLSMPLIAVVPTLTPVVGYFEMVSALTTTGATVFDLPTNFPITVHLYRALVAWSGGFLILLAAIAIMSPLNIGGFEIRSVVLGGRSGGAQIAIAEASDRLVRFAGMIFPIYFGLTAVLALLLAGTGQSGLVAIMTAMATVSTSGILPVRDLAAAGGGVASEVIIAVFLVIGATALIYDPQRRRNMREVGGDPELRMLAALCIGLPGALFLRHWLGALELDGGQGGFVLALHALWGAVFTVLSFLTTFGLESASWDDAQGWSGLATPGLLLMGLAMLGGGVATTAGGVKLLRIYALYKHGTRELRRLTMPHSIGGDGQAARRIRTQGAFIAWIFLMLFLLALALVLLVLTAFGLPFEEALRAGTAALTNTGPGYLVLHEAPRRYADFSPVVHMTLTAAMVVGRLETLALIALLNPEFWRR
ncbi:trk system potassium uptake protein TrkH [Monaibacterium marinum]|uniref:Trk system potassium uptake protein TrkH n=1 Tax=Pontivivens marinum TaxID=1690039 RepID=A0A2C9CQ62_9RHOB|nr:potassium transporter TrkG [Monaibacterium marinum]SOH93681.1 trk system potassium uptake protein TrkH [Monaibacterium marinum]